MQELINQYHRQHPEEACEICCLNVTNNKIDIFHPSVICYNCWHQHIKATITKISYKTGSEILNPFEGGTPVDVCIALNTLKAEHSVELEEWLFKKYSSFTTDIEKCPSETCDYVFTMEKCKWRVNEEQKCPKCEAVLATSTSWDLKGLIGFVYFLFLTNKCPKCEIPIQKTTGCPHMTCPCGHQFCWYCLKDYFTNRNNVYSVHEPRECAFIFLSKIIFMSICVLGVTLTFLGNQVFHAFIGYFFIGLKYLLLTLFIDLILISNFLGIGHIVQKIKNIKLYGYDNSPISVKVMIGGLSVADLTLLILFFIFEMYSIIGWILLIEGFIAAVGAVGVWLIVYSVETWFDYIC